MNKTFLLDTHVWIWYVTGNTELKPNLQEIITDALAGQRAYISAISLWEIGMLEKKQRIILDMPCLFWINQSMSLTKIQLSPLSVEIAIDSCHLPNGFHPDPADRIITSTARIENHTLITRDERILKYGEQGFVTILKA